MAHRMGRCGLHTGEPDSQPKSQGAVTELPCAARRGDQCDRRECENGCLTTSATSEISFFGGKVRGIAWSD